MANGETIARLGACPGGGGGQGSEGQACLITQSLIHTAKSTEHLLPVSSPTKMTEAVLSKSSLGKLPFVDVKNNNNNWIVEVALLMT